MTRTLIGSQALYTHFPKLQKKPVKDTDYFVSSPEERYEVINESEHNEAFYHPYLEQWTWGEIASPEELYTIKVSHAFWELDNKSWDKHMFHLRQLQVEGVDFIPELYDVLYPIWEERYGKKKANLNVSAEEFFTASVTRVYDHDSIHASVAYYDEPLFNEILRDGSEVAVSREKFENLPHAVKIQLVREEVYATALERILIPIEYKGQSPRAAYSWALRKTITSFSKGWFPLFIVTNYHELASPDVNFVQVHRDNAHKLIKLDDA